MKVDVIRASQCTYIHKTTYDEEGTVSGGALEVESEGTDAIV